MDVWGSRARREKKRKGKLEIRSITWGIREAPSSLCQLINPVPLVRGGLLGASIKRCSRGRGRVPCVTAGTPKWLKGRGRACFISREAREGEGKSLTIIIFYVYEGLRNFVSSPGISHWAVSPLWGFYLMLDWFFSWFLVIRSLSACPEENLCFQHPSF